MTRGPADGPTPSAGPRCGIAGPPRERPALPICGSLAVHGNRAIPVPQKVKTLVPWELFTHSLAKVRS